MPAGLQIVNTHGTVLIDDTSPCLQLRAKYTVSVRAGSTAGIDNLSVPNVDRPLFVLRPHVAGKRVYLSAIAATGVSTTKLLQLQQTLGVGWDESGAVNVDVYHFDRPAAPTSNAGLQVYDAAGNCTFDAMGKTAVVVGVVATPGSPGTIAPAAGRVYGFASPAPYNRFDKFYDEGVTTNVNVGNLGAILGDGSVWMSPASNVRLLSVAGGEPPDTSLYRSGTAQMLAIDVTGY